MGVETKLHEAQSRFGLVGDAIHGVVERGVAVAQIARIVGHDALTLIRGHELVDQPLLVKKNG